MTRDMRYILYILFSAIFYINSNAQNYNQEKTALTNFLVRMYKNAPFEGVKLVTDYNNNYLLSVVLVKRTANSSDSSMNRVAQVKSSRQVSQFLNDGVVYSQSETIIRTTEDIKEERTIEEVIDVIKENSVGFTKSMEILTAFDVNKGKERCFMFFRKVIDIQYKH